MATPRIVIIDNDNQRADNLKAILDFIDFRPSEVIDNSKRQELLGAADSIRVVVMGDCGSDKQLTETFNQIRKLGKDIPILLLESVKGILAKELSTTVSGYVEEPFKYSQLTTVMQKAHLYKAQANSTGDSSELFRSMVGNSPKVKAVGKMISRVADSNTTVLILGESGTGKEVVARKLHYQSARRSKPFVPINCGAIPPDLLESELFGHEKGAFTGAVSARQGRFEMAHGGTLFLDEIGDMSMHMQVKLLRVLQERTFERVGGNKSIMADVRIIAATHRNLEDAIKENKFREDLYYRLNVFPIVMPPLRERLDDVPLLINELITRLEHEKRGSVRLTPQAVAAMCEYTWPGNVRELANFIERLLIMYPFGVVDVQDLPEKVTECLQEGKGAGTGRDEHATAWATDQFILSRLPREGLDLKEHLYNLELNFIKQALDDAGGVVAHAATRLKLRRTTLVEKLRKYGIQRSQLSSYK